MPACLSRLALLAVLSFVTLVNAAETVVATARQPDGKIVVAAVPQNPPPGESRFLVGRLLADGNVDTAFGDQGWATFGAGNTYATFLPTAIAVASTGRIVVAFQQDEFVGLGALTSTGARDENFGWGSGKLTDWDSAGYRVNAIAISESSPLLVNGQSYVIAAGGYKGPANGNNHWDVALLRYNLSGYRDPSFGTGGMVRLPFGAFDNEARAIVVTPFSSMFLAGYTTSGIKKRNFLVARVNMNGSVESSFGSNGRLEVDYMGQDDEAYGIAFNAQITRLFVMGRAGKPEGAGVRGLFGVIGLDYDGTALTSPMLQVADVALESPGDADATALAYIPVQAGTDSFLVGGTARSVATGKSRMVVIRCDMGLFCGGNSLWGTNGLGAAVLSAPAGDSDAMTGMFLSDAHQSAVVVGTRTSGTVDSMMRGEFSTGTGYLLTDYTLTIPETTITSGPPSVSASRLASFVVTSDRATTFECALDAQPFALCNTFAFEGLADGQHVFNVRAYNYAGTDPTPATWTWTVDATAPETTIWAKPGPYLASKSIAFEFGSNDAGATFECNVDGAGFAACSPPVALSGLAEGLHTFAVRARDAVGNVDATPDSAMWTVDTILPETIITGAIPPQHVVNVRTMTISFAAPGESGATFECSLNGTPFVSCASPVTYSNLADRGHSFVVRARDLAGNPSPMMVQYHWVVDTIAPSVAFQTIPSQQTSFTWATISFTSSDAVFVECSLDGAPFIGCTSPMSYYELSEGQHTFAVRATDALGNVSPNPPTLTWSVDLTAPETLITSGPPEFTNSTLASFTFSAAEAATFDCRLDGGPWTNCTGNTSTTYGGLAPGMHRFEVRATDLAHNFDASPSEFLWVVDLTPPTTTLTSAQPSSGSTQATFTFVSNEPTATFTCRVDVNRTPSAPWLPCVSPVVLSDLMTGQHVLEVRAKDAAGNVDASPASVAWSVSSSATDPIETTILSGPIDVSATTGVTFTFTASAGPMSFQCRINSAAFASCSSPRTYSFPNGSTQTFQVRARHPQTGEWDPTPASSTFTVDVTAPVTNITSGPPSSTTSTSATFTFASVIGATYECRLDGGSFAACATPMTYSGLARTAHQFYVRARDSSGKLGPAAMRAWTVN